MTRTPYIQADLRTAAERWLDMSIDQRAYFVSHYAPEFPSAARREEFWQLPIAVKRAVYDSMAVQS